MPSSQGQTKVRKISGVITQTGEDSDFINGPKYSEPSFTFLKAFVSTAKKRRL